MLKSEAISIHAKDGNWGKFAVFVWEEGGELVTQVDGKTYRAKNCFGLDSALTDGGVPMPRNLYLVDEPDYEDECSALDNGPHNWSDAAIHGKKECLFCGEIKK